MGIRNGHGVSVLRVKEHLISDSLGEGEGLLGSLHTSHLASERSCSRLCSIPVKVH